MNRQRDWSTLPSPVLDNLAEVLKRNRRWKVDGPSLRQVNKHWSEVMESNVLEVRPHPSRKISETDVASLARFPRLTSIDISRFLDFWRDVSDAGQTNEAGCMPPVNLYAKKLKPVMDVLVQLRRLRQIELHCLTAFRALSDKGQALRQFSRLTGITSLCIYGSVNPKLYEDHSPIAGRNDALCSMHKLEDFFGRFPKLKCLEIYGSFQSNRASDTSIFKKVASAKVCSLNTVQWCRKGSHAISFLTALNLFSPSLAELDMLRTASRLEELSLSVCDARTLTTGSVIHVLGRLKNLTLRNGSRKIIRVPSSLFYVLEQVERLCLMKFEFFARDMKDRLGNVRALKLVECRVVDCDLSFLSAAKRLESLSLRRGHCGNIDELEAISNAKDLPRLRSLFVAPISDVRATQGISRLSKLEVLGLRVSSETALQGLRDLNELSNLRVLGLSHSLDTDLFPTLRSLDLLGRLERLLLDQICISSVSYEGQQKCRVPRLILEDKRVDFYRFAASNFF